MSILSRKDPAGTEPSSRFEPIAVPVAEISSAGLAAKAAGHAEVPGDGQSLVAGGQADARVSLEAAFNGTTGCDLHGAQDSTVCDARAGLTPSDMVTNKLAGLLDDKESRPIGGPAS